MKYWHYRNPGEYVRFYRESMAALKKGRKVTINGLGPYDEQQFRYQVRLALDRRINLKGGMNEDGRPVAERINRLTGKKYMVGRRFDSEYQIRLTRDARNLNLIITQRVRIYNFETEIFRKRFARFLARNDD